MGLIEIVLAGLCLNATCEVEEAKNSEYSIYNKQRATFHSLAEQLKQETLRIATYKNDELSGYDNKSGVLQGTGVAFEIIKILQNRFGFNYSIIVPEHDVFLDASDKKGAKNLLEESKADLAAAFLPVINSFRNKIRYSFSLDLTEWVILMNRPYDSANGQGLLAPFTTPVWILIIFSILIVGPIIYLMILIQAKLCRNQNLKVYALDSCIWFVYGALLKQGSTLSPKTNSSRMLFATWWIFILILTAFYTANLTAFLTLSTFTLPIESAEDIGKKHYHWVTNKANGLREIIYEEEFGETYQQRLVDQIGNYQNFPDGNDLDILKYYVARKGMMFIREKKVVDHVLYRDYKDKTQKGIEESKRCTYVATKFSVISAHRAFAYSKGFKYSLLFDNAIQHLVESGIVQYKLRENLPDAEICPLNLKSTERKLKNTDLLLTYEIVGTGLAVAACVFLLEILWNLSSNKCKKKRGGSRNQTPVLVKPFRSRDNSLFDDASITPPPSYQALFKPPFTYRPDQGVKKNINGRDYWVVNKSDGFRQLVPLRAPSALLFQYSD